MLLKRENGCCENSLISMPGGKHNRIKNVKEMSEKISQWNQRLKELF